MFGQAQKGEIQEKDYERIYVRVTADHLSDGCVFPRVLFWLNDDGVEIPYEIDRSSKGSPAHARKAGGQGLLFHVNIQGYSKELFYDDFEGRFFVEKESLMVK